MLKMLKFRKMNIKITKKLKKYVIKNDAIIMHNKNYQNLIVMHE